MNAAELWNFPCEFALKVIGKASPEFEVFVLATIRRHVADLREDCIEARSSKGGAYLALTIKITAASKEQLDTIYRELSASELVLVAL
jgi:putative lipoic acid-binding regulatory protein